MRRFKIETQKNPLYIYDAPKLPRSAWYDVDSLKERQSLAAKHQKEREQLNKQQEQLIKAQEAEIVALESESRKRKLDQLTSADESGGSPENPWRHKAAKLRELIGEHQKWGEKLEVYKNNFEFTVEQMRELVAEKKRLEDTEAELRASL